MKRQTQGSFDRSLGELAKGKSQSGTGRKYQAFDFKKFFEESPAHVSKGDLVYNFEQQYWYTKK